MELTTWVRAQWDRVLAWLLVLVGLVVLLIGWLGVSATPYLAEQLPYLVSAGMLGLFLLGLGATVWISADLRDEWRKLDELTDVLTEVRSGLAEAGQVE
jgi:vacuolar-type H+-ATPase subunit I/STV1